MPLYCFHFFYNTIYSRKIKEKNDFMAKFIPSWIFLKKLFSTCQKHINSHKIFYIHWHPALTLGNLFQEYNVKEVKSHMHRYFPALFMLETTQMPNNREQFCKSSYIKLTKLEAATHVQKLWKSIVPREKPKSFKGANDKILPILSKSCRNMKDLKETKN